MIGMRGWESPIAWDDPSDRQTDRAKGAWALGTCSFDGFLLCQPSQRGDGPDQSPVKCRAQDRADSPTVECPIEVVICGFLRFFLWLPPHRHNPHSIIVIWRYATVGP